MRQYRPHSVHSRKWGGSEAVFGGRLAAVPVVIHSEHGYELDMLKGLPMRRRLIRRAAYAAADAVFTVSSDLRDYHARQIGISREKVNVLVNGVDSERFAPRPEKRLACRADLGLPGDSFLVGTARRLVAIKDQSLLLPAAQILVERGFELSVALAGDVPELDNLRSIAASPSLFGRVHFLRVSRNIADFLNALDVFVLHSGAEGSSNTDMEAMSSSLPVVATRVGGNPELIEDRMSGLLFRVGEVAELVEHLSQLAANSELRQALGASARARILRAYRLDSMIARYRNLYMQLAARRKIVSVRAAYRSCA